MKKIGMLFCVVGALALASLSYGGGPSGGGDEFGIRGLRSEVAAPIVDGAVAGPSHFGFRISDFGLPDPGPRFVRQVVKPPLIDLNVLFDVESRGTILAMATPVGPLTSPKTHRPIAMMYVLGGMDVTSDNLVGCFAGARTGKLFDQVSWRLGLFGGVANDKGHLWRGGFFGGLTVQF